MKTIYAIKDRVANELVGLSMYTLFVFRTDQQAVRYFADAINDEKSILNKHPNDYELVKLGELEETMGGEVIKLGQYQQQIIITGSALVAIQDEKIPLQHKDA